MNALIEFNLVAVRPSSAWARELPEAAFGPTCCPVATASSAAALYCMRELLKEGLLVP